MSVYFAGSCGYMKIGYSADPIARSTTITVSGKRPNDLPRFSPARLIGWVPGDRFREMEMHVRFGPAVAGEWFASVDEAEVRDLIWADPCGIHMREMSGAAVLTAINSPEGTTRADIAAAGIQIEATNVTASPDWAFLRPTGQAAS